MESKEIYFLQLEKKINTEGKERVKERERERDRETEKRESETVWR